MTPDQGFVDLRLNRQEGQTEESFWPSFTDIMTVIVMIFLLAMVILLIRNMELVEQLRATMEAERLAAELARSTGAEKDSLTGKLDSAERELVRLRDQIGHMSALGEQQEAAIASQRFQIAGLSAERDRLEQERTTALGDLQVLDQAHQARGEELTAARADLTALQARIETEREALQRLQAEQARELSEVRRGADELNQQRERLQADYASQAEELTRARSDLDSTRQALADLGAERDRLQELLTESAAALAASERELASAREVHARSRDELQQRYDTSAREVEALVTKLQIQEQALAQAMARLQEANLSLSSLQADFGDLRLKYDDLVKPARTAEGRFLVEVRYAKEDGQNRIRFRESRDDEFRVLDRDELDRRLTALRERHKQGLYVRVIIPEDSGLSYSEAWNFTSDTLRRFDYYYQNRNGDSGPDATARPGAGAP